MDLLVNNKIISLDLPVKDVYQKVWAPVAQENEPMRIIYRMRGLLGDATEEFIENLANKDNEDQDEEEIYKMANVRQFLLYSSIFSLPITISVFAYSSPEISKS